MEKNPSRRERHFGPAFNTDIDNAVLVERTHIRVNQSTAGEFFKIAHLPLQLVWKPQIVSVQKRDVIAIGLPYPTISGGGLTTVNLIDIPDLIMITSQHSSSVIRRAIIYHDDLFGRPGLPKHTLKSRGDIRSIVVNWNNRTNGNSSHCYFLIALPQPYFPSHIASRAGALKSFLSRSHLC